LTKRTYSQKELLMNKIWINAIGVLTNRQITERRTEKYMKIDLHADVPLLTVMVVDAVLESTAASV
jgi:hypothetical protein